MPVDCFSVLVILIIHRFDLALHASLMVGYIYSMFLLFFIKINKNLGRSCRKFIFSFLGMPDIACIFA
jgi:hypothetical protein